MSLPSIETLGGQAVEPFSRQPARSEVVEQFREIVEQMVGRLNAHRHLDTEAPARAAAPGLGVSAAVATQLMLSVPTPSRHGLSATGSVFRLNQLALERRKICCGLGFLYFRLVHIEHRGHALVKACPDQTG